MTTNVSTVTGDGIDMAVAVGAATVDMDQIQIHPSVYTETTTALITEGIRGDGAILVNQEGKRFVNELEPATTSPRLSWLRRAATPTPSSTRR